MDTTYEYIDKASCENTPAGPQPNNLQLIHSEKLTGATGDQPFYKSDLHALIEAVDFIKLNFPAVNMTIMRNMILSGRDRAGFTTAYEKFRRKGRKHPTYDEILDITRKYGISWMLERDNVQDTQYPLSLKPDSQSFDFIYEKFQAAADAGYAKAGEGKRMFADFIKQIFDCIPEEIPKKYFLPGVYEEFCSAINSGDLDYLINPQYPPSAIFSLLYESYYYYAGKLTFWNWNLMGLIKGVIAFLIEDEFSLFAQEAIKIITTVMMTEMFFKEKENKKQSTELPDFQALYTQSGVFSQLREVLQSIALGDLSVGFKSIMILLSFGKVIDAESFSAISELVDLRKVDKLSTIELLEHLSNVETIFSQLGEAVNGGKTLKEAIFSVFFKSDVFQDTRDLLRYKDKTYNGLPLDGHIHYLELYDKLKQQRTLLINFSRRTLTKSAKRILNDLLSEVDVVLAGLELKKRGNNRPFPFGIVLHGPPGIGKGKLLNQLCVWWYAIQGKKFEIHHRYQRTRGEKFWSGYDTQDILHLGEVGNVNKNIAMHNGDEDMVILNSIMSSEPFALPQADLGSKGNSFVNVGLVLVDTNNPDMNLKYTMATPSAMERRFTYIEMEVKDEFRKAGTTMIDPEKSLRAGGCHLDRYYFTVTTKPPGSDEVVHASRVDIFDLRKIMMKFFQNHLEIQGKTLDIGLKDVGEKEQYMQVIPAPVLPNFQSGEAVVNVPRNDSSHGTLSLLLLCYTEKISVTDTVIYDMPVCYLTEILFVLTFIGLWFGLISLMSLGFLLLLMVLTVLPAPIRLQNKMRNDFKKALVRSMVEKVVPQKVNLTKISFVVTGLAGAYYLYTRHKANKSVGNEQATTQFKNISEDTLKLNQFEHLIGSELAYKKIPNKLDTNIWMDMKKPLTKVFHKSNPNALVEICRSNTRLVAVHLPTGYRMTHILGLRGQFALINTHALKDHTGALTVIKAGIPEMSILNPNNEGLECQQVCDVGNDISVIKLSRVTFRDIVNHLSDVKVVPTTGSVYTLDGLFRYKRLDKLDLSSGASIQNVIAYNNFDQKKGYCGKALIAAVQDGYQIVGFHAAGHDTLGSYGVIFDKLSISKALEDFATPQSYVILSDPPIFPYTLDEPNEKSLFRYNSLPGVDYLGSMPGSVILESKSRLKRSIFSTGLPSLFKTLSLDNYELLGRPVLRPTIRNEEYVNPYTINMLKMNTEFSFVPHEIKEKVVSFLVQHLTTTLRERGVPQLSPLTFDEAINGGIDDPFIRRVNPSTGAGFPLTGKKNKYLPIVEETATRVTRETSEELNKLICNAIAAMHSGVRPCFVSTGHLKDEPRTLEKIREAKTRLFYGSELTHLVLSRQFFAPFYSLMVEHGDVFCTAVGSNVYTGVDKMLSNVLKFPSNCNEGDYSSYDITTPFFISEMAYDVRFRFLREFGYNEEALKIVSGLTTEDLFPIINILNDLFIKAGLQPSGKGYTAEDNSLKNLIMLLLCWVMLELPIEEFFTNVGLLTLGDDVLFSVSDKYKSKFNAKVYQRFCKVVLHMKFTSSDKDKDVKVNIPITECSFLKRNFNFNPRVGKWVAPLHPTSIMKSLYWRLPSNVLTEEEQSIAMATSALYEAYLHFIEDVDKFDIFRNFIIECLCNNLGYDKTELELSLPTYPTIQSKIF